MARFEKSELIKRVVVDASVITRWYLNEEWSDIALQLRKEYQEGKLILIAPFLLYYEVANALRYSNDLTQDDLVKVFKSLLKLQLTMYYLDDLLLEKIAALAVIYNISIYDSSYLAIAEILYCKFMTGDAKLCKKINQNYCISLKNYDYDTI